MAKTKEPKLTITVTLSEADAWELMEALDSHEYWQLSQPKYRRNGFVIEPGTDDEDDLPRMKRCQKLEKMLSQALAKAAAEVEWP